MKIESIREYRQGNLEGDPARAAGEAVLVRLATRLHTLRTSLGLTQTELASRAGLDQASISDIENGDANPTTRTLGRIAAALGIDAGALLTPTAIGIRFGSNEALHNEIRWRGQSIQQIRPRAPRTPRSRFAHLLEGTKWRPVGCSGNFTVFASEFSQRFTVLASEFSQQEVERHDEVIHSAEAEFSAS